MDCLTLIERLTTEKKRLSIMPFNSEIVIFQLQELEPSNPRCVLFTMSLHTLRIATVDIIEAEINRMIKEFNYAAEQEVLIQNLDAPNHDKEKDQSEGEGEGKTEGKEESN